MINAQIVADSLDPRGNRLTSMLITFPRFILAELNTHRMLSKNSASSRAIPFNKMVESVQNNPFIPIAWQKDHKGMQGSEYLNKEESDYAKRDWLDAKRFAIDVAQRMHKTKVTKQLCNRLLEPFMWHTVLITGSKEGWDNFFNLRCPIYTGETYQGEKLIKSYNFKSWKDLCKAGYNSEKAGIIQKLESNKGQAEIHMMALAEAMWDAMNESTPEELQPGEWHIPFENKIKVPYIVVGEFGDLHEALLEEKIKISTAMAARTSYTVIGDEKEFTYEQQIALHDRMINAVPFHASPFEHCAKVMSNEEYNTYVRGKTIYEKNTNSHIPIGDSLGWCRNYKGFIMYRELLENK